MKTMNQNHVNVKELLAWTALAVITLAIVIACCFAAFSAYELLSDVLMADRSAYVQTGYAANVSHNSANQSSEPRLTKLSNGPAYNVIASGTCGRRVSWSLDETGTLYIWGSGAMYDYKSDTIKGKAVVNTPWDAERNEIQFVVISDGVTHIGARSFEFCKNLMHIEIPDSVTSIGQSAFQDCDSLYYVTLPDDITKIEKNLFYHCDGLAGVSMPANAVRIEDGAFRYCRSMTDATIPMGVVKIGGEAFEDTALSSVVLNSHCKVGYQAFPRSCVVYYN